MLRAVRVRSMCRSLIPLRDGLQPRHVTRGRTWTTRTWTWPRRCRACRGGLAASTWHQLRELQHRYKAAALTACQEVTAQRSDPASHRSAAHICFQGPSLDHEDLDMAATSPRMLWWCCCKQLASPRDLQHRCKAAALHKWHIKSS